MEIKTLHVEKLTPEGAQKIQEMLVSLPGVENVEANLAQESITVTFDENQVGLIALEEKIAEAGYPVKGSK